MSIVQYMCSPSLKREQGCDCTIAYARDHIGGGSSRSHNIAHRSFGHAIRGGLAIHRHRAHKVTSLRGQLERRGCGSPSRLHIDLRAPRHRRAIGIGRRHPQRALDGWPALRLVSSSIGAGCAAPLRETVMKKSSSGSEVSAATTVESQCPAHASQRR